MIILVSVVVDKDNGCDNFPTANNCLSLLYSPTVVTYGVKYDPVANSNICPLFELPDIMVGF